MNKYPIERCDGEDDPERCQGQIRNSDQCMNKRLKGSSYCAVHGGNKAIQLEEKNQAMMFRLTQFKERVKDFATNPGIKGLREEIGITRMILEELLNGKCKTATDLLMHSSKISALIRDISILVQATHKLESSMGVLLDKMSAVQLSQEIVTIISEAMTKNLEAVLSFVPTDDHTKVTSILECDLVDQIVDGIGGALEHAGSKTE